MTLGIDIDGCLADFVGGYMKLVVEMTGKDKFPAQRTYPDFPTSWNWDREAGYTQAEVVLAWDKIKTSPRFWRDLPDLPTTRNVLSVLSALERVYGHNVYFLTNRMGDRAKAQTEAWLYKHGFDSPTVLLVADKGPVINALGIDVFVDDRPDTIKKVVDECPNTRVFVVDYAYNRDDRPARAEAVSSVLDMLQKLGLVRPVPTAA